MTFAKLTFNTLIAPYEQEYLTINRSKGSYNNAGIFIPGEEITEELKGIFVPPKKDQFVVTNDGVYKRVDLNLITLNFHNIGTLVEYKGNIYKILEHADLTDFSQVTFRNEKPIYGKERLSIYAISREGRTDEKLE